MGERSNIDIKNLTDVGGSRVEEVLDPMQGLVLKSSYLVVCILGLVINMILLGVIIGEYN